MALQALGEPLGRDGEEARGWGHGWDTQSGGCGAFLSKPLKTFQEFLVFCLDRHPSFQVGQHPLLGASTSIPVCPKVSGQVEPFYTSGPLGLPLVSGQSLMSPVSLVGLPERRFLFSLASLAHQ